jgi:hypothetical protein
MANAQMSVSVCGEPAASFEVSGKDPVRVYLRGGCEPREVRFSVLNPFTPPGSSDSRSLGAKLVQMRLASRLGPPLMNLETVSVVFGALLLLGVLAWWSARNVPYRFAVALGAVVIAGLVPFMIAVPSERYPPLWFFAAALLTGTAVASSKNDSDEYADISPLMAAIGVVGVLILGLSLRVTGIGFGLPANFHPDEVPKVNAIMRMVDNGDLNPRYFLHPTLLLYCTYAVNTAMHALGIWEGTFRETAFFAGRMVSLTAGTLSIVLLYGLGAMLFNRAVGLAAAMFLAVFPLHVTCSRYLKEDALLTFFVLLTVLAVAAAVRKGKPSLLLLGGLAAGLTAGSKYSGILMAGVVAAAPWLRSKSWWPDVKWLPWAVAGVIVAPLGFLLSTPYSVLDSAIFLKDFRSETRHMSTGHTTAIDPWSMLWMYHFDRSMLPGMTSVVALASVAAVGFLSMKRRFEYLLVIGLIGLFYLPAEYVKAKPAPQPERYIVPCLPFMALALSLVAQRILPRARLGFAVCAVLAVFPLLRSANLAREVRIDTRDQMARWMLENIPHGSRVYMDWRPYSPYLEGGPFQLVYIPRAHILKSLDPKALRATGGDYLVLSSLFYDRYFSQPEVNPHLRQKIREVFERMPVVTQVRPQYGTYGFHNPVLTVFSLKPGDIDRVEEERKAWIAAKRKGDETARAQVRW